MNNNSVGTAIQHCTLANVAVVYVLQSITLRLTLPCVQASSNIHNTPALNNITSGLKTVSCSSCFFSRAISCLERTASSSYSAIVFSTSPKISSAAAASRSLTNCLSSCGPAMMEHRLTSPVWQL